MNKLSLAFVTLLLGLVVAHAQSVTGPTLVGAAGVYNSAPPTCTAGQFCFAQVSVAGRLLVDAAVTGGGDATAANQVLQITQETAFNTALGAMADAACATDNGTCSTIALIKRTNQRLTTVIAGIPVTNAGTFVTQSAITAASGSIASGAVASGAYASGALASGSVASGALVDLVALSTPVAPATAIATKGILLGAQATTAAVNPTTGQQGALSSDTNNNLLVSAGGAPNLTIAQVSIATSDTLAIAARALRRSVTIQQITGTQNVFCNQTTATAGNGVVLPAVVGASFTFQTTSAIRCIAITGAQTVAVAETF